MASDEDVRERLDRLEAKLERVLRMLEERGNGHDRSDTALGAPVSLGDGPGLTPFAEATARATAAHAAVEGAEALTDRLSEAALELIDPDTLRSLTLLAQLAPRIEYAAQAAAAGPALLDDFLHAAHESLESRGVRDPGQSLDAATDALIALTRPEALEALGRLGEIAPHLSGLAGAAAEATQARAAVEGEAALQERLREAVLELSDPEVLDALVRIAQLTPKLEFAAFAAAAAPALLEDVQQAVREQVPDSEARLEAGIELLRKATSPEILAGLAELTEILPDLADRETGEALKRLASHLPTLDKAAQVAGWVPAAIETAAQEAGHADLQEIEPQLRAGVVLILKLAEADTLRALTRLAEQSGRVVPLLDRLAEVTGEVNLEGLADVLIAAGRPDVQEALAHFLALAPTLVPVIEALPVQPRTLEVLKTVNQAVEETSSRPREVGALGLLRGLGDRDVRRALGFALDVASRLGARLDDVGRQPLPPGGGGNRLES